jgi:predicted 3-demethylubiquinone-9 3-methyltransferase (glyoxalase superfamily)
MPKITPFLWFETQAEQAARFYISIFENSRLLEANPTVVRFELDGQEFMALSGGPQFKFNEAISFLVPCQTQEEIDRYWAKLTADGGEEGPCGWLKDKFGVSWQVAPTFLGQLIAGPHPKKAERARQAMTSMKKLDIAKLQEAYDAA